MRLLLDEAVIRFWVFEKSLTDDGFTLETTLRSGTVLTGRY